jgi:hypothetical protein
MFRLVLGVALGMLLCGCGVKLPPIAPDRKPEHAAPKLDCSPQDPNCDKTDPNYKKH